MKINIPFATYSLIVLFTVSCSEKHETATEDTTSVINEAFLENIKTAKSEMANLTRELVLTGKVEYDPDKVIAYVPLVSGIIDRTHFSLGDKVAKGQTLVDIRSSDLTGMRSELLTAESEMKKAEREMSSAQSFFDDGMLSEKELLEAKSGLVQAQSAYEKLKNDMSVYDVNSDNGTFKVKSPGSGYIVAKTVTSGSTVSPESEPLFTVADLSTVWIIANVYAGNLRFVKEGMEVEITSLSYPGEIFSEKINALSQVFDPEEKVLKARIIMPNNELKFKPEMSVVVKLKDETNDRFVAIPSDALVFDNDKYFVVVQKTKQDFEIREVVLHGHNDNITYIESGLEDGEDVIVKNQLLVYSALNEK